MIEWHLSGPTVLLAAAGYLLLWFRLRALEREVKGVVTEVRGLAPALDRLVEVLRRAGSRGLVSLITRALDSEAEQLAREWESKPRA